MTRFLWVLGLVLVLSAGSCGSKDNGSGDALPGDATLAEQDSAVVDMTPLPDAGDKDAIDATSDQTAGCVQGMRSCLDPSTVVECQGGQWVTVSLCHSDTHFCSAGTCVEYADCNPGDVNGCYSLMALNVCNEEGSAYEPEACPSGQSCIGGACIQAACIPGQASCIDSSTKQECLQDGSGWSDPIPCEEGLTCVGGKCLSQCLTDPKWANSYIGCEYWTVDLDNYHDPFSSIPPDEALHGLILGNPGTASATVTFTSIAVGIVLNLPEVVIPAGETAVVELPRMDIDGSGIFDRSIRVNSNRPIVAYQFNPLDFQGAYSDDSSLLIPAEMLGTEYFIITRPTSPLEAMPIMPAPSQHGYFTVVATEEGTTNLSITVTAACEPLEEGGALIAKGTTIQQTLQQFEVLSLEASGKSMFPLQDLTGSHVVADRPIAVFAGHEETVIEDPNLPEGEGDCCCAEHIEEQFFPVATWSTSYHCVKARSRGAPDEDLWIVMAADGGTTLTTDPPVEGLNGKTLATPGASVEAFTDKSFVITSNKPIQVAQILSSQGCTAEYIGDPAMIMAVAQDRYRNEYVFAAPKDYEHDYITVIRPEGLQVLLDGAAIADSQFTLLSDGLYEYAWVEIADGPHHIVAEEPFGLSQYGWQGPASYGNPGGLDLVVHSGQ